MDPERLAELRAPADRLRAAILALAPSRRNGSPYQDGYRHALEDAAELAVFNLAALERRLAEAERDRRALRALLNRAVPFLGDHGAHFGVGPQGDAWALVREIHDAIKAEAIGLTTEGDDA